VRVDYVGRHYKHTRIHAHEKEEGVKAFDGKGLLGRARCRWKDNIKMNIK
jgi:hypothetical protein